MRIEVLYVPGCPNYQPILERIQEVLASESVRGEIHGVPVRTEAQANSLQFPGSPTIPINGKDVEPGKTSAPGLACRLYANLSGVPSEELLRLAVSAAKREG
jgi:hypothetical protein